MIKTEHKDVAIYFEDRNGEEGWKFDGDPNRRVFPKLSSCKDAIDKMLSVKYYEQQVFTIGEGYMSSLSDHHYRTNDTKITALIATRPHRDTDKEFWVKERNPKNPKNNRPELSRSSLYLDNDHNRAVIPKLVDANAKVIAAEAEMIAIFKTLQTLKTMEQVAK